MDGERPGVGGRLFLTFAGLALTLMKRIFSSFYERVCVCEHLLPLFGEQFRVPVSRLISRSPAHENKFGQACPGHGFGFRLRTITFLSDICFNPSHMAAGNSCRTIRGLGLGLSQ